MLKVTLLENEDINSLLKRFKTAVRRSGILDECKRHEYFLKKSLKRKQKSEMAKIKKKSKNRR